jgi:hypothetical protein
MSPARSSPGKENGPSSEEEQRTLMTMVQQHNARVFQQQQSTTAVPRSTVPVSVHASPQDDKPRNVFVSDGYHDDFSTSGSKKPVVSAVPTIVSSASTSRTTSSRGDDSDLIALLKEHNTRVLEEPARTTAVVRSKSALTHTSRQVASVARHPSYPKAPQSTSAGAAVSPVTAADDAIADMLRQHNAKVLQSRSLYDHNGRRKGEATFTSASSMKKTRVATATCVDSTA